jgi:hypothetical protein
MFDKTYNSTNINHPEVIKHIHNHAPTDKSIELLNEFREKALENHITSIRTDNNEFDATFEIFNEQAQMSYTIVCKYKLNHYDKVFKFYMDRRKFDLYDTKTGNKAFLNYLQEQLFKHLSNEFANIFKLKFCMYEGKIYDMGEMCPI